MLCLQTTIYFAEDTLLNMYNKPGNDSHLITVPRDEYMMTEYFMTNFIKKKTRKFHIEFNAIYMIHSIIVRFHKKIPHTNLCFPCHKTITNIGLLNTFDITTGTRYQAC